jgi:hypothetical protein
MNTSADGRGSVTENGSEVALYKQDAGTSDQGGELVLQPVRVHGKRPGCAKVVLDIDRTDSARKFQAGIPVIARFALRSLETSIAKLDIDLWTHGDESCGELPIQLIQSGSIDQVIEGISGINYRGGFDPAETHAEQLQRILDVTHWGLQMLYCRNIVVSILSEDTKPLRSRKSMHRLGFDYRENGVKLVLVCQPTPNLQEIVDAAGGFLIPISNSPDQAEIQKVTEALCATLTMPVMSSGGTIPMSAVGV